MISLRSAEPIDVNFGESSAFNVSIIVPLYNKARFIRQTLRSALAQVHPATEIIIVDDSSTDASIENIRDLIGGKVRLVSQANAGPGPARNRGIAEARSEWIAFLDADDLWRDDHLSTLGHLSRTFPEAMALATAFERCRSDEIPSAYPRGPADAPERLVDFFEAGAGDGPIWTSCVAVKREAILDLGGFANICPGEDRELWVRIALDHPIARSERCTAIYTQNTGGIMETLNPGTTRVFAQNPVFATLDNALRGPRYRHKHKALEIYRTSLLKQNVRQALYRGDPATARTYLAELRRSKAANLGPLRLLAALPAHLLAIGMTCRRAIATSLRRLRQ